MPRVIHTAQALVDAVMEVPALPSRGGNVMATSYHRYAGGAVTILLAAARSGASCVHAGAVGTGPNGDLVRAALAGVHGLHEATEVVATLLHPDAVTIVRDGPRGCAVREGGTTHVLAGHPQRPVDTNGAGDTHTGVLLAERAAGASWRHAAARANAAGAIKVTRRGPDTAPTRAEIDAFLGR
jgi:sugar/nucleoside kinase (ribokinase family)